MPGWKKRRVALGADNVRLINRARRNWYGRGSHASFDNALRQIVRVGLREAGYLHPDSMGHVKPGPYKGSRRRGGRARG